jgi:hypothetical protein
MQPLTTSFLSVLRQRLELSGVEVAPGENPTGVSADSIISGQMPIVRISRPVNPTEGAHPDTIESQIAAYYYMALTNVLCQAHAPDIRQVEDDDPVKALIDTSYRDFHVIDNWLAALDVNQIRAAASGRLYREVQDAWRHHVRDWRMISRTEKETLPQSRSVG